MMPTKIILTQGKVAIVDAKNHFRLAMNKWYYTNDGYAVRNENGKTIRMHRVILERKLGHSNFENTDHINRDRLDNRKDNLRPATVTQNQHNRGKPENNTSGFKGVFWHKRDRKWIASIRVDGELLYLGYFDSKEAAAGAYNAAAKEYFGEFAVLNII